ncbi:12922_t:CDS:2, partial [Funneliformis geosporum]
MRGDSSDLENGTLLYPIRVDWQTVVEQNNRHFYMHITEGNESSEILLGYRYHSGSKFSDNEIVLSWDDNELLENSLKDLYFQAFAIKIDSKILWPVDGEFSGFVRCHALPNFGKWNNFSPSTISKSMKGDEQYRSNSLISTHTNTDSKWIIPLPSINHDSSQNEIARIKRMTKNNIKEELEKRSLYYDEKKNQPELIAVLNENIAYETINKIAEAKIAIDINS